MMFSWSITLEMFDLYKSVARIKRFSGKYRRAVMRSIKTVNRIKVLCERRLDDCYRRTAGYHEVKEVCELHNEAQKLEAELSGLLERCGSTDNGDGDKDGESEEAD